MFGKASGHGMLSNEQPVLFAGEIEITENGQLTRWNNMSGTYKFHQEYSVQAELPLDRFWGVVEDLEVPMRQDGSADWLWLRNGVWLHKCEEATLSEQVPDHPTLLHNQLLHSFERVVQVQSCDAVYTSLFDVVGPSVIGEIKEDGIELRTQEQLSGELVTLGSNVDASAAGANAEMPTNSTCYL